jgi:TRAP-type C4-dicarboxylate transport system permease small subunit
MGKKRILIFSDRLDRFCRGTAVGFFSVMLVLVVFQVVARYVFQSVPVWTEEAARYCMVWGGLLGATAAFKAESDPRLIHPPKSGSRLKIAAAAWVRAVAVVVFLGPVLYHSDKFLMRTWHRTSEALGISSMWITLAVPTAVAIILFHLVAKLLESSAEEVRQQKFTAPEELRG